MTHDDPKRLPQKYYQRRRAAAVVVIVVVVGLLVWLLTALGGRGADDANTAAQEQTSSVAAPTTSEAAETTEDSATAEASETSEATESESESEASESGEPESPYPTTEETTEPAGNTCAAGDLAITASSDQATYPSDAQPTFYMTVANPTEVDCEVNLDESILRFEVYDLATNQRVWSDTDCFEPVEMGEETFAAGEERYFEAVWSRRGSAPGECSNRPIAPSGSYFLHAVVGTNPSPAHTFNLA